MAVHRVGTSHPLPSFSAGGVSIRVRERIREILVYRSASPASPAQYSTHVAHAHVLCCLAYPVSQSVIPGKV